MDDTRLHRLVLHGAVRCMGMGLLIGALEALPLAVLVKLPLGVGGFLLLATVAVLVFGALGFVVGVVIGVPVHWALRRVVVSRGLAAQLALTTFVLVGTLFAGFAMDTWAEGRVGATVFLGLLPVFLLGTTFLLSSALFRAAAHGASPLPVGFLPVAAGGALLMVLACTGLRASRDAGGQGALPSDPRFVVIVVDSLRADLGGADAPNLRGLAARGTTFSTAVTPSPATGPAVATLLTGLSPLRHEVVEDGRGLRRIRAALPNTFSEEGYATAGFVGVQALSHDLGFDNGFAVYDDDLGGVLPGLSQQAVLGPVLRALGLSATQRDDDATVGRFTAWLAGHHTLPFFAMVHLHGPREPFVPHGLPGYEANGTPDVPAYDHAAHLDVRDPGEVDARLLRRLYAEEVQAVDVQIGRIVAAVAAHDLTDNTVIVVVGTGGELLGEHEGAFTHRGLWDETVRVPLILRLPGVGEGSTVDAQVRVHDLYPTLVLHAELALRHEVEAIPLRDYIDGTRGRPLWTALVGRDVDGTWLVGARNNGVKYLRGLASGSERLFDTEDDPGEQDEQSAVMPDTLVQARGLVSPDAVRLGKLLGQTPAMPATRE